MDETRRSGFTLFELLLTLTLVGLLAGLAVPAMGRFVDNARLGSATQALSQELRRARNHALTHQQAIYFSVQVSQDRWCFGWSHRAACDCRAVDGANACHTGNDGLQRVHRQSSTEFPGVQLSTAHASGLRIIRFSPVRGTASADSFSLQNRENETRVIVSLLGRVRLCSIDAYRYPPC